jgi:hypothetical protein
MPIPQQAAQPMFKPRKWPFTKSWITFHFCEFHERIGTIFPEIPVKKAPRQSGKRALNGLEQFAVLMDL